MSEPNQQQSRPNQERSQDKKKKNNGCLLAIVITFGVFFGIAFLGIIAAVAIPGFMAYIQASKTAEAKTNLMTLAKGASEYQATNKHFLEMPEGVRLGPAVSSQTIGFKSTPNPADFEKTPWKELNFKIDKPYYYSYFYRTQTIGEDTVVQIIASASLSDECDSIFYVFVDETGATPIMEGDASLCNIVTP